jgi:DNA-binding SARP family transcriptional activator
MTPRSSLETLGKFQFTVDDRAVPPPPTNKARALLAYLVSNRGRDVARERLTELFWSDFEPARAREGLRTALSSIRHSLRSLDDGIADMLHANKSVVQWSASTLYDVDRFVELARSGHLIDNRASLGLYKGDFLEGNYEEWAVRERERLATAFESALAAIVSQTGDVEAARLLLSRNPYSEAAYGALIDAENKANRPGNAAALLQRYRAAMAEVGSEPSAAFEERYAAVQELADDTEMQLAVPFVARTVELQLFARAFQHHIGADGYVALVIGEPGIGKTALSRRTEEVARNAERRSLTIRCSEDPRRLSAWRSLYERLTGRKIDDLAAGTSDVATAAAREIVEAFGRPTVLFIDDAHLLTGDSLATLAKVIEMARGAGHGLVISLRPEGRERIEPLVSAFTHDSITLGPLERRDIETALALTVDADTPAFADTLYERSGGHPLFFVALLQSLVQKQALRRERGRWRVVRTLDERLELPQDVRASIDGRLRAAGDDAAVVACALALEPSSTAEDIAAALDYAEPRVLDALDALLAYGLIAEAPGTAEFRFAHDIVREVSAVVLNPGRRVALHRAFARRFEKSRQPEASIRLARHLRAAGMAQAAANAYLKAAQTALARYAVRDAAGYCIEAVQTLERVERSAESDALLSQLHRTRARAAAHAGDIENALDAADQAVEYARVGGETRDIARALLVEASIHGAIGDVRVELSDALEAAALASETGERGLGARAAVESAAAARSAGAFDEAIKLATEAASIAAECQDPAALYAADEELISAQICWWRFADAAATMRDAIPVAQRLGSGAQARLCCLKAANDYLLDHLPEAAAELESALRHLHPQRIHSEGDPRDSSYVYPLSLVAFTAHYLRGILACTDASWDAALKAADCCKEFEAIVKLPRYEGALMMLQIDAFLGRDAPGDSDRAGELGRSLTNSTVPDGIIGWSDCTALVRARLEARLRKESPRAVLRSALDALEENAQRIPLDCDAAFARLARAADEAGETAIRERALTRSIHYRGLRTAAALRRI